MRETDALIIGAGQGAVPLARHLAGQGKRVIVFERDRAGGSCINWGCTPTQIHIASAQAAANARRAAALGVRAEVRIDFPAVMERVRSIKDAWMRSTAEYLEDDNLEMVEAEASFDAAGGLLAAGESYRAPLIVIDTGSSAAIPPIPGLDETPYLTDRTLWELEELPGRLLVLGGGFIGVELGQAFARLGCEVHIVDMAPRLLPREAPDVSSVIEEALRQDGVRLHLQAGVQRAEANGGKVRLLLADSEVLEGDRLLVVTGRRPNTSSLNAPAAGIELDERGFVKVDEGLRTTRAGVYAIGEAAGQPAFTHVSYEDGRRIIDILGGRERRKDDRVLGYAVFSDPQIGRAGLTLAEALERGLQAESSRVELAQTKRGIEWGQGAGFFELVYEGSTGKILGTTLVGYEAAELIHLFIDLMEAGVGRDVLARAMHIHPTFAEYLTVL
ncbi:MAG: dihydrolipoyl dehydrogenase family protein [Candidatus Geothermincolia bacterium]